ncbi:hypothetical protein SanaruYs_31880 [Chryseotalea sanaruensis]|uniref:Uncharacterized protein n=1 Tax=Chryseotalea sanaruensis TaxID=2482724 RepID=A0A401UDH1_9BACT|nr:hypothetical protein [Chryseotalea sanaruensis]GCC52947.1 hypothetical protein SanaruYs_31880 [Chryseotalea sanaruensis]
MSPFEYVSVLISIILGLGITVILTGLADIIKRWEMISMYWPYGVWMLIVFVLHIQEWWITYSLRAEMTWTLPLFLFIITYPIVLFVLAHLLFPQKWSKAGLDLKQHYLNNYRKYFGAALLLVVISILQNHFVLDYAIEEQLGQFFVAFVFLTLLALKQIPEKMHGALAILMLLLLGISFIFNPDELILK